MSRQRLRSIRPRRNSPLPKPKPGRRERGDLLDLDGRRGRNSGRDAWRAGTGRRCRPDRGSDSRRPVPAKRLVTLPETITASNRLGRPRPVSTASDGRRYTAHLRQLSDAADAQTRTYEARYVLDGEAAAAPLGATVTIRLASQAGRPEIQCRSERCSTTARRPASGSSTAPPRPSLSAHQACSSERRERRDLRTELW